VAFPVKAVTRSCGALYPQSLHRSVSLCLFTEKAGKRMLEPTKIIQEDRQNNRLGQRFSTGSQLAH